MAKKLSPDRTLFMVTVGLVSFGLVMLYSASAVVADASDRTAYFLLIKQVMWAALGLVVLLVLMRIDYRHYRRPLRPLLRARNEHRRFGGGPVPPDGQ